MLSKIKRWIFDLIYGKDYFSVRCCGGNIYCLCYQDGILERTKMSGLIIEIDVSGKYEEHMADVTIQINGIK